MCKSYQQDRCSQIYSLVRNGYTHIPNISSCSHIVHEVSPWWLQWKTELLQSRAGKCMSGVCWMRGWSKLYGWNQAPSAFLTCSAQNFLSAWSFRRIRKVGFGGFLVYFSNLSKQRIRFYSTDTASCQIFSVSFTLSMWDTSVSIWVTKCTVMWVYCRCCVSVYIFVWGHRLMIKSIFSRFAWLLQADLNALAHWSVWTHVSGLWSILLPFMTRWKSPVWWQTVDIGMVDLWTDHMWDIKYMPYSQPPPPRSPDVWRAPAPSPATQIAVVWACVCVGVRDPGCHTLCSSSSSSPSSSCT